jgi:V8-like Glu-specific endopeptidase
MAKSKADPKAKAKESVKDELKDKLNDELHERLNDKESSGSLNTRLSGSESSSSEGEFSDGHLECCSPEFEGRRASYKKVCDFEESTFLESLVLESVIDNRMSDPVPVHQGRPLDAWFSLNESDLSLGSALVQADSQVAILESVVGFDDRRRVSATLEYPWRCICALHITAADGSLWRGTGWISGARTIITAGHCVHMSDRGGWVDSILVIPGADGYSYPFGSAFTTDFRCVAGWVENQDFGFDYGAIILEQSLSLESLGRFGFAALPSDQLTHRITNLAGYPSDKPENTQWIHSRPIREVEGSRIRYAIDTAGGQSGSPVWFNDADRRIVAGIHTAGRPEINSATLITPSAYANIVRWSDSLSLA